MQGLRDCCNPALGTRRVRRVFAAAAPLVRGCLLPSQPMPHRAESARLSHAARHDRGRAARSTVLTASRRRWCSSPSPWTEPSPFGQSRMVSVRALKPHVGRLHDAPRASLIDGPTLHSPGSALTRSSNSSPPRWWGLFPTPIKPCRCLPSIYLLPTTSVSQPSRASSSRC